MFLKIKKNKNKNIKPLQLIHDLLPDDFRRGKGYRNKILEVSRLSENINCIPSFSGIEERI